MRQGQELTLVLLSVFLGQLCWTQREELIKGYYTSTHGVLCSDSCKKHGGDYYWCNTRKGWDYCSPSDNTDYKGDQCKDDHPCEKYGKPYYWCNKKNGTWGNCGKVEPKPLLHMSSKYQIECRNECLYDDYHEDFWCNTDKGLDKCSPELDFTYKNEPCRSGYYCGNHEYEYTWCKTGVFSWDYCGLVKANDCRYDQLNNAVLVCTEINKGYKKETKFYVESASIEDGSKIRNKITDLISRWDNEHLHNQATSGLITSEHLRVNIGLIEFWNNQRYNNLQIQINTPLQTGTSTTVAQVLIPHDVDIPGRYVRMAFTESFRRRAKIIVCVKNCK